MVPIIGKLLHFSASKSLFFFITSSDSERNKHRSYPILLSCWCSKSWGQFCCMSLIADELLILISFVHAQYGAVSGFIWPTFEGIAGWLKFCESSHRWGTCPPKLLMLKLLCLLKDLSSPLRYMCVCVCVCVCYLGISLYTQHVQYCEYEGIWLFSVVMYVCAEQ